MSNEDDIPVKLERGTEKNEYVSDEARRSQSVSDEARRDFHHGTKNIDPKKAKRIVSNNTTGLSEISDEYYKLLSQVTATCNEPPLVTFGDIKHAIPYIKHFPAKFGLHNGQRKLFLSEVQFLTDLAGVVEYVIYAGAAPSHKGFVLWSLFPKLKFVLIDPNRFEIFIHGKPHTLANKSETYVRYLKTRPRKDWLKYLRETDPGIFIIEDFFTEELATMFSALNSVFISDIRTNMVEDDFPTDIDILWNSAQQMNWIKALKPKFVMLKFRPPYFEKERIDEDELEDYQRADFAKAKARGMDFIANYNKGDFLYFDGTIFLQAWSGKASSETRLVFDRYDKFRRYDSAEYENKFFYFMTIGRTLVHRRNEFADEKIGFDHCNDCALEAHIWRRYMDKLSESTNTRIGIKTFLDSLKYSIHRGFFMGHHGFFFNHSIKYLTKKLNFKGLDLRRVKFAERPYGTNLVSFRDAEPTYNNTTRNNNVPAARTLDELYTIASNSVPEEQRDQFIAAVKYEREHAAPIVTHLHGMERTWQYVDNRKTFRVVYSYLQLSSFLLLMRTLVVNDYRGRGIKYVIVSQRHFADDFIAQIPVFFPDLCVLQFGSTTKKMDKSAAHAWPPTKPGLFQYAHDLDPLDAELMARLRVIGRESLLFIHIRPESARHYVEIYEYLCYQYLLADNIRPNLFINEVYRMSQRVITFAEIKKALRDNEYMRRVAVEFMHGDSSDLHYLRGEMIFAPYTTYSSSSILLVGETNAGRSSGTNLVSGRNNAERPSGTNLVSGRNNAERPSGTNLVSGRDNAERPSGTNLVSGRDADALEMAEYSAEEHNNNNFYYKTFVRTYALKKHDYADREWGFDYCNDCAFAAQILEQYIEYIPRKERMDTDTPQKIMRYLVPKTLKTNHGLLFTGSDEELLRRADLSFLVYNILPQAAGIGAKTRADQTNPNNSYKINELSQT